MTSQPEKEGLKLKYLLTKVDGSTVDPDGDYFIIKLNSKTRWHREASIKAILAYAESVKNDAPQLAVDIITKYGCTSHSNTIERDKVLDELRIIKEYDCIRFHQKHTLPKSWAEVKVTSVSKDGKRIGISGKMPGEGCTTQMGIDRSDVRQVCRWIELPTPAPVQP